MQERHREGSRARKHDGERRYEQRDCSCRGGRAVAGPACAHTEANLRHAEACSLLCHPDLDSMCAGPHGIVCDAAKASMSALALLQCVALSKARLFSGSSTKGDIQAAASLRSSSRSMRCELHPALHLLNVWDGEVQETSGLQGQSAYRFAAWVTLGPAIRNVGNGRWMATSRFCKLAKAWNLTIELPSDSWPQSHALHSLEEPAMEAWAASACRQGAWEDATPRLASLPWKRWGKADWLDVGSMAMQPSPWQEGGLMMTRWPDRSELIPSGHALSGWHVR